MSFCYLLNAALLLAGVLGFILAGFAGTFSQRLYSRRYRLMLGPLGFVVLGSISHSITAQLLGWYSHTHPAFHLTHPAGLGSAADIFESILMLASGIAGVLCGVALGASLDREPANDATYTIANYWNRRARSSSQAVPALSRKENVVAISKARKQPGGMERIAAISETAIPKDE